MPALINTPFRVYANQNLGMAYDHTHLTGEWTRAKSTGQAAILPTVNLTTGNLATSSVITTQEQIGNSEFGFVYNAQSATPWTLNTPEIINISTSTITYREKDGSLVNYVWDAQQNAYIAPCGGESKPFIQKQTDGTFVHINSKNFERKNFSADGKLQSIVDTRGRSMQYHYDGKGDLENITSAAGVYQFVKSNTAVTLQFTESGKTSSVQLAQWIFDDKKRLTSALIGDSDGYRIHYDYVGDSSQLASVTQDDQTSLHFTYSNDNKVQTIQQGVNNSYQLNYNSNQTIITDPLGFSATATLNAESHIEKWEQQVGDTPSEAKTLTTVCTYINGNLQSIKKFNGALSTYKTNAQGLVTEIVHSNGQTTQYEYDATTGACLIQRELTTTGAAATHFVYETSANTQRLRFTISPKGSVTEYRYNDDAQLTSKRIYLKETRVLTSVQTGSTISYDDMTAWANLQSADQISLETYLENNRGQRTQTQTFTTINADGTGKDTHDAGNTQSTDLTIWGGVGASIEKLNATQTATTHQIFDALHRLTSHENALQEKRLITYEDQRKQVTITQPNGRAETSMWDETGNITKTITTIPGSKIQRITTHQYDTAGRKIAITHIDGQTTYQLFDNCNRLRFTITPTGRVTEHQYDDSNRTHQTICYFNPIQMTALITFDWITKNLIIDSTQDITTYQSFDLSHRLQFEVDGRGALTEHRYDLQNRKIAEIQYATAITTEELAALKTGQLTKTPTAADHANLIFYDQDSHIIATQNAMGYVITHQRNAAGLEIYRHHYATKVPIAWDGKISLPAKSSDDFSQYYYHDARGQVRLTVDGVDNAHTVTRHFYTATGDIDTECRYVHPSASTPTVSSNLFDLLPEKNIEDRQTSFEYDALKRVITKHLPEARLQTYRYDNMGHEILESHGDDKTQLPEGSPIQTHAQAKQYDAWGQLTEEITPKLYEKIIEIENNQTISESEKSAQKDSVWKNQARCHIYDDKTGLHLATRDISPDDADCNDPAVTTFYRDVDQRVVLTIGPEGQVKTTDWHPAVDQAVKEHRYAAAIDADKRATLTGGFITPAIQSLLQADPDHDAIDQYAYDGQGSEIKHIDPDGYETQTRYHPFGHWCEQKRPVHDQSPTLTVTREVNAAKQIVTETLLPASVQSQSITTKKSYDNCHGLCTAETDANGAVTTHGYEPRGVLLSTTDARHHKTTFEHDAFKRITKQTAPLGESQAIHYDQASRSQTTAHLDQSDTVLSSTSKTTDAFGNVIVSIDAQGEKTTTEFDADNQMIHQQDALGNEINNTYDRLGLHRIKTRKRSNGESLETTTYTYTKSKKERTETCVPTSVQAKTLTTTHHWNALGQRFRTIAPNGTVRLTEFNKRSLATKHHACFDAKAAMNAKPGEPIEAVVTEHAYNGQKTTHKITQYTHGKTQSVTQAIQHDGFNRPHQKIIDPDTLKLTRTTDVDNAGYVIATTDPKGQITYHINDALGHVRFEMNPKGGVTERCYDANHNLIQTTQYATAIDLSKVIKGMSESDFSNLLTKTQQDRQTTIFYDALNQERFRLNRNGAVVETRYNKNGQEIASIHYYNQIKTDPVALTTETLVDICGKIRVTSKDKATFRVLDAIGQERFVFNAEGFVTEKEYLSIPHTVNHETQYAVKIENPEDLAQLSIDDIKAKLINTADDRQHYHLTDAQNRVQFDISPTGAVTRYDYDGDTHNKTQIIEFAESIDLNLNIEALQSTVQALILDPKKDKVEKRLYDQAGREIERIHAAGSCCEKFESWEYDGASRKTKHITVTGHTWEYASDGANRLITEYSPETDVYQTTIDTTHVTGIDLAKTRNRIVKKTDYDANDNPTQLVSAVGLTEHKALFEYDGLDQKIKDTWPELAIDDPTQKTDLLIRPETTQSIHKQTVCNPFGAKLVEVNEAGNPTYYCYNTQGHLIYRVNSEGYVVQYVRNAFGEAESFIFYSNKLTVDLSSYQTTGLTAEVIVSSLQKDLANDRSFHQTFDRLGQVTQVQQDAIVCYIPNKDPDLAPVISTQTPTKTTTYNAFGEEVVHATLIDQNTNQWRTDLTWTDALGKIRAIVAADGKACIYTRDARGRLLSEYAYATRIPSEKMPTDKTTFGGTSPVS